MKALIDTNILLYAIDLSDERKHLIAKEIVKTAFTQGAFTSAQNLGEFYHVAKKKFTREQQESVNLVISSIITSKKWVKLSYDARTIIKAVSNNRLHFDFWDSVIYFTMLEGGVLKIITENKSDFEKFGGVEVENPFI